jgi:N-formylglutamate deformylase
MRTAASTIIDPAMLADAWPLPLAASRKTGRASGSSGASRAEARRCTRASSRRPKCNGGSTAGTGRITRALAAELDALHRTFGAVWHINCHSMPAVGDANADDAGRPRKDFVLGDRDGTTCEPEFTALVAENVAAMGYSVAINDPYKGVEIVRRYGRPGERRHSLQIELNRRLYMDERRSSRTHRTGARRRPRARRHRRTSASVPLRDQVVSPAPLHSRSAGCGGAPCAFRPCRLVRPLDRF